MLKSLLGKMSKLDFGYACKIFVLCGLLLAAIVFCFINDENSIWISFLLLGIIFWIIGNLKNTRWEYSYKQKMIILNSILYATVYYLLLVFVLAPMLCKFALVLGLTILINVFQYPLSCLLWQKNGIEYLKENKDYEDSFSKLLDSSLSLYFIMAIIFFIPFGYRGLEVKSVENEIKAAVEKQKKIEIAGKKGIYHYASDGEHIFVVDTVYTYIRSGYTNYMFVTKEHAIVCSSANTDEMVMTRKGHKIKVTCQNNGYATYFDNLNIVFTD